MTNTMVASGELRSNTSDTKSGNSNRRTKLERTDSPVSITCYPSAITPSEKTENGDHDGDRDNAENHAAEQPYMSVRFKRFAHVCIIPSRRDFSLRQIQSCWYQSHELREIKSKCVEDVRKTRNKEKNGDDQAEIDYDDGTCCTRGLETFKDKVAYKRKKQVRAEAATIVFDAEDEGRSEIAIARVYSSVAAQCQTWANIVGLRDERDAVSI
jgi:hypothetical protein